MNTELKAGCKYLTTKPDGTAGPVVRITNNADDYLPQTNPELLGLIPFVADDLSNANQSYWVGRDGNLVRFFGKSESLQITGEYREPTIAERLEEIAKHGDVSSGVAALLTVIVADVRKLEAKS